MDMKVEFRGYWHAYLINEPLRMFSGFEPTSRDILSIYAPRNRDINRFACIQVDTSVSKQ
jgi:hypothetical protein